MERQDEDEFCGVVCLMMTIHSATAGGFAKADPVGGTIAGSGVRPVHQGLQPDLQALFSDNEIQAYEVIA